MHSDKEFGNSIKFSDTAVLSVDHSIASINKQERGSHFDFNFDFKLLGWSLLSFLPWAVQAKDDIQTPATAVTKGLKTSDVNVTMSLKPINTVLSTGSISIEKPKEKINFDFKLFGWSVLSLLPLAINAKDNIRKPATINKGLRRHARSRNVVENGAGGGKPLRFRPYVSKVPWHTGPRGFLSQLFPRYGHYCGPNWSSGKDGGSLLWDKRPIDWLDYCCYCHDIGYDSHDQAELLKADLEFLECLERPNMITRGDTHVAYVYRTMCITGLRNFLIPYRTQLVNLQFQQPMLNFGWLSHVKWVGWNWWKS